MIKKEEGEIVCTYLFKLLHIHIGEVCLQLEVGVGAAATAQASRWKNLKTAVTRITHFHRRVCHFLHHHDVSALSSPAIPILQQITDLTFVVLVDIKLLLVHSLLLNSHLVGKLILVLLLLLLEVIHLHLVNLDWRREERGGKPLELLAHAIHHRLYYPPILLYLLLLDVRFFYLLL